MSRRNRIPPFCYYCRRDLAPPKPERGNSLTLDHVIPESAGGWRKVPCCRTCNNLKGDISPADWTWFIARFPRWWKSFRTTVEVRHTIREHRFAEAMERSRRAEIERIPLINQILVDPKGASQ